MEPTRMTSPLPEHQIEGGVTDSYNGSETSTKALIQAGWNTNSFFNLMSRMDDIFSSSDVVDVQFGHTDAHADNHDDSHSDAHTDSDSGGSHYDYHDDFHHDHHDDTHDDIFDDFGDVHNDFFNDI